MSPTDLARSIAIKRNAIWHIGLWRKTLHGQTKLLARLSNKTATLGKQVTEMQKKLDKLMVEE